MQGMSVRRFTGKNDLVIYLGNIEKRIKQDNQPDQLAYTVRAWQ